MASVLSLFLYERASGSVARSVGIVAAWLTAPVRIGVASRWIFGWARPILGLEALLAGPRLDQRAVHREVLVAEQLALLGKVQHFAKQRLDHRVLDEPIAVLGEGGVIPDRIVDGKPHKPAKQQVVVQLLHQQALAAHRIEHLQQQSADELLGGDGSATTIGVDLAKQRVEPLEGPIHHVPNRTQRMVNGNKILELGNGEQRLLCHICSTHTAQPLVL